MEVEGAAVQMAAQFAGEDEIVKGGRRRMTSETPSL